MKQLTSCALVFIATSIFAETPWYKDRGTPVTFHPRDFVVQALLPRDWSIVDGTIVPPAALGPDCHARVEFYRDREWDRFLVSELASTEGGERAVLRINGRPAVSNQYSSAATGSQSSTSTCRRSSRMRPRCGARAARAATASCSSSRSCTR